MATETTVVDGDSTRGPRAQVGLQMTGRGRSTETRKGVRVWTGRGEKE